MKDIQNFRMNVLLFQVNTVKKIKLIIWILFLFFLILDFSVVKKKDFFKLTDDDIQENYRKLTYERLDLILISPHWGAFPLFFYKNFYTVVDSNNFDVK